jgi:hypothetical protein
MLLRVLIITLFFLQIVLVRSWGRRRRAICKDCGLGRTKSNCKECSSCGPGYSGDPSGISDCTSCSSGSYNTNEGSSCATCPSGWYQDEIQQSTCKKTGDGKYNSNPTYPPEWCKSGEYPNAQQKGCESCPSGWQRVKDKPSNNCEICPIGTYEVEKSSCKDCPEGKTSDKASFNSNHCECKTGRYDESCYHCPEGFYSDERDSKYCKRCEIGRYQNIKGEINCLPCSYGKSSLKFASKSIEDCKACATTDTRRKCEDLPVHSSCELSCPRGKYFTECYTDCERQDDCMKDIALIPSVINLPNSPGKICNSWYANNFFFEVSGHNIQNILTTDKFTSLFSSFYFSYIVIVSLENLTTKEIVKHVNIVLVDIQVMQ